VADHRPGGVAPLLVVALGGAIGTACRYGVSMLLGPAAAESGGPPWDTLTVNLTGAGLLGVLVGALLKRPNAPVLLRPFAGTGVLGGYTTFSALALETVQRWDSGHPVLAAMYLVVSIAAGVLAATAGIRIGSAGSAWPSTLRGRR
jgi:fluoride exporter